MIENTPNRSQQSFDISFKQNDHIQNRDSNELMKNCQYNFRENIRYERTKQQIASKRIRQFQINRNRIEQEEIEKEFMKETASDVYPELIRQNLEYLENPSKDQQNQPTDRIAVIMRQIKEGSQYSECLLILNSSYSIKILIQYLSVDVLQEDVFCILSNLISNNLIVISSEDCERIVNNLEKFIYSCEQASVISCLWCFSKRVCNQKFIITIFNSNIFKTIISRLQSEIQSHDFVLSISFFLRNITQNISEQIKEQKFIEYLELLQILINLNVESIVENVINSLAKFINFLARVKMLAKENIFKLPIFNQILESGIEILRVCKTLFQFEHLLELIEQLFALKNDFRLKDRYISNLIPQIQLQLFTSSDPYFRKKSIQIINNFLPEIQNVSSLYPLIHEFLSALPKESEIEVKQMIIQTTQTAFKYVNNQKGLFTLINQMLIQSISIILKEEQGEALLLPSLELLNTILHINKQSCKNQPQQNWSVLQLIEEIGLAHILINLQEHPSDKIYSIISQIIHSFFDYQGNQDCSLDIF